MSTVFFRHVRNSESDKGKVSKRKLRTLRDKTVAGIFDEKEKTMKIGISECCKHDNFNKKVGRSISKGRASKRPEIVLKPVFDYDDALQKFHTYVDDLTDVTNGNPK